MAPYYLNYDLINLIFITYFIEALKKILFSS